MTTPLYINSMCEEKKDYNKNKNNLNNNYNKRGL